MTTKMKYMDEGMDCKKYFLFLLKKFWVLLLAAFIGAVLGGGIYLFYHVVINSNREYRAESQLYLNFAPDETGETYQAYNGYTWNDLMSTDPILNTTMSYLPKDYTKEEVEAATSAEILSDLRVLTITITTPDPNRTEEILRATDLSLVDLGKTAKEFRDIEIYKETEAEIVAVGQRLLQAVLVGVFLAVIVTFLAMALLYVLDDKIYVPGDCKCFTELPFVGFSFTKAEKGKQVSEPLDKAETERTPKFWNKITDKIDDRLYTRFRQDLEQNQAYLEKQTGTLALWKIEKDCPVTQEDAEELQKAGGVLLVIPYGRTDRATCSYQMEQLALLGCNLTGILIQDADMRFMRWYYKHL